MQKMLTLSIIVFIQFVPPSAAILPIPWGLWPLNSANRLQDISGNNLHASTTGKVEFGDGPSASTGAMKLSSQVATDVVYVSSPLINLDPTYSWTFSVWVNLNNNTWSAIVEYNNEASLWGGANHPGGAQLHFNPASAGCDGTSSGCDITTWQFVAVSFDVTAQQYNIYCNQSKIATNNCSAIGTTTTKFSIGNTLSNDPLNIRSENMSIACLRLDLDLLTDSQLIEVRSSCLTGLPTTTTATTTTTSQATTTLLQTSTIATSTVMPLRTNQSVTSTTNPVTTASPETIPTTTTIPFTSTYSPKQRDNGGALANALSQVWQMSSLQLQKQIVVLNESSGLTAAQFLNECDSFAPYRASPAGPSPTPINVTFAVDSLDAIDTVQQSISVAGTLLLSWKTTCPSKSIDKFTSLLLQEMYVATTAEVWTPPFSYVNTAAAKSYMQDNIDFDNDLIAGVMFSPSEDRTFMFYWVKHGQFTSNCNLDLTLFPFDKQTCLFAFSFLRSTDHVIFANPNFLWTDDVGDEWNCVDKTYGVDTVPYKGKIASSVYFAVTLQRIPTYYLVNLVLPNSLLIVVQTGSFLMPPDLPDRPALSTTLLLALAVSQTTVMSKVPETTQRILLVDYIMGLIFICVTVTLYELLACVWATNNLEKPVRKICCGLSPVRVCDFLALTVSFLAIAGLNVYFFKKSQ